MSEELGRIEKPSAERFREGRKLYLVPLIYQGTEAPGEFVERFELYWQQVAEHIANLEASIGRATHIFHESVTATGDEGLELLRRLNEKSYQLCAQRCQEGTRLQATEDRALSDECMDWERFLLMGFLSATVAQKVSELYVDASRRRYEHIARRIDEELGVDEAAILFIMEGHWVQFPSDVEVFSVAPPALDQIHRWLRDRQAGDEGTGQSP